MGIARGRLAVAALLLPLCGSAQPSGEDGIPRMPDGRPDLRGIWQALNTAVWNLEGHGAERGVPAGRGVVEGGAIPYLPDALLERRRNYENRATEDPEAKCYMVGVPRITYMPYPFQIMQTPEQLTILYEYVHTFRNIHIGSEHPPGPIEWWMGDSRAHWESDTLVVDVIHFTDQTWLDRSGNHHGKALHVVERFALIDADHMRYEATLEDPETFSRPWTIGMPLYRRKEPNVQILDYECYAFLEDAIDGNPAP